MIICSFCLNHDTVGTISFGKIVTAPVEKWNFTRKGTMHRFSFLHTKLKKREWFLFQYYDVKITRGSN